MAGAVNVLCVPFAPSLADSAANRRAIITLAGTIAAQESAADIIVLPELALSGYLLESLTGEVAETHTALAELARDLAATGIRSSTEWVIGLPLGEGASVYNAAAVIRGGEVVHVHRKMFLPTYGMFDEERYFTRGNSFAVYDGALGRTALLICEDAWHPELAYVTSAAGAETVIVISASPARGLDASNEFTSSKNWRQRLATYAEAYAQKYIYCNRSGVEDGVLYDGTTFVYSAHGSPVAGEVSEVYRRATRFVIIGSNAERPGFAGDPTRQADTRLITALLDESLRQQ